MTTIKPNVHGDWISLRNTKFDEFIPLEPEKKFDSKSHSFFSTFASAIVTSRDAWVLNFSEILLNKNMKKMVAFYNEQCKYIENKRKKNPELVFEDYLDTNPQKISWTRSLRNDIKKSIIHKFKNDKISQCLYRPFTKEFLYYDKPFIESPGLWSKLLPPKNCGNYIICLTGKSLFTFSALISNHIAEYGFLNGSNGTTQCFPLYWYEKKEKLQSSLFEKNEDEYIRHDAISDFIINQAKDRYGPKVSKEDIFYFVYGILHSPDYRRIFANDLKKMLPRLPLIEKVDDFWSFSRAGKELADLHLNYENQDPLKEVLLNDKPVSKKLFPASQLLINKMSFSSKEQKDTIIYNSYLTISNIPAKAYEYIVNGKSAIEWVMERYAITTHKESGIKNDPNDWAMEHENPQYILDLLLSVITVSVKTVEIVENLPKVEWE
jgi:predicted helicase